MKKKLKITGFRVLIRPDAIDEMSPGGIALALDMRRARAAQTTGVILDIGPTAWMQFQQFKDGKWVPGDRWAEIGDHVVYTRYGGRYVPDPADKDKDLIIVSDEDVLAVLPK